MYLLPTYDLKAKKPGKLFGKLIRDLPHKNMELKHKEYQLFLCL